MVGFCLEMRVVGLDIELMLMFGARWPNADNGLVRVNLVQPDWVRLLNKGQERRNIEWALLVFIKVIFSTATLMYDDPHPHDDGEC